MEIRVVKVFLAQNSWTEFRGICVFEIGQSGELRIFHDDGKRSWVFASGHWMSLDCYLEEE